MFRGAGGQEAPISRDQIDREQIITREPVFPGQPTQPPTQREARDARRGVRAAGGGQAKRLGLMIELAPRDPAFRTGCPAHGVNMHALSSQSRPHFPRRSRLPSHQLREGPQLPRHIGAHQPEHHLSRPLRFHGGSQVQHVVGRHADT